MWYIVLVFLSLFLYLGLKKILGEGFLEVKRNYISLEKKHSRLLAENQKLKEQNSLLEKLAQDTIAIYDITKEICKSLDEDKVFTNFSELLSRYIKMGECRFIKDQAQLKEYPDYTVLPLNIDKAIVRYLAVNQIEKKDSDVLEILAGQFLLGLKRAVLYQKIQELAITDSLTNVFSRRYLWERFNEELERCAKFNYHFSVLMIDIDHFKDYNDRYGHLVGDAILKEVAQTIKENIRQIDLVGRYGGEEFMVILSETDKEGAKFAAERIRQAIGNKTIRIYDEELGVSLSIGGAVFPEDASKSEALVDKADKALYQAKELGRNRVCIYSLPR